MKKPITIMLALLAITRVPDSINGWGDLFKVDVYYEFFNPGPAKDLIVGFEATSADGNAYGGTLDEAYAGQPFIYDFNVVMNGRKLPHQVAHVPYKYNGDYLFDYILTAANRWANNGIDDFTLILNMGDRESFSVNPTFFNSGDEDYPISRDSFTDEQRRILKNVPFAYRGYVFKDKSLQSFFESTDWYIPDPGYNADMTTMTPGEKKWVQYWTK